MNNHTKATQIHRCLKPSLVLYFSLGFVVLVFCVLIFVICKLLGQSLIIASLLGFTPLVIVSPLADYLARKSEYKNTQPNILFDVDREAEKLRYGPLRAEKRALKHGSRW